MTTPSKEKRPMSRQQKQYIALGVLGVILLAASWSSLFSGPSTPAPPPKNAPADGRVRNSDLGKQPDAAVSQTDEPEFGPAIELPIALIASPGGSINARRNVFDYPPPPPVRPPPREPVVSPGPPPTIALGSISPSSAIAGSPKDITVTLSGTAFPSDAQVYWDGRIVPSQRISDNVLRVTVGASDIATPRAVNVEVKSKSQPMALWSRAVQFQLQASPDPVESFTFTGRIGNQALITFRDTNKRPSLVSVGDTIAANVPWKVLTINDRQMELLDTRNQIKKTMNLAPKAGT